MDVLRTTPTVENECVEGEQLGSMLAGPKDACRSGLEAATAEVAWTPWGSKDSPCVYLGQCCKELHHGVHPFPIVQK